MQFTTSHGSVHGCKEGRLQLIYFWSYYHLAERDTQIPYALSVYGMTVENKLMRTDPIVRGLIRSSLKKGRNQCGFKCMPALLCT